MKYAFVLLVLLVCPNVLRASMGVIYYLELEYKGDQYYHQYVTDYLPVDAKTLMFGTSYDDELKTFDEVKSSVFGYYDADREIVLYHDHVQRKVRLLRMGEQIEKVYHQLSRPISFTARGEILKEMKLIAVVGTGVPGINCSAGIFEKENPWPTQFELKMVGRASDGVICDISLYTYEDWFLPAEIESIIFQFNSTALSEGGWVDLHKKIEQLYNEGIFVTVSCSC